MSTSDHQTSPEAPVKRRRKIWSCGECRRRKLQCDRALPACTRCSQLGQSDRCIYLDDTTTTTTQSPGKFHDRFRPPVPSGLSVRPHLSGQYDLSQAADRSIRDPAAIKSAGTLLSPDSNNGIYSAGHSNNSFHEEERLNLTGSSVRIRFNGRTHSGCIVAFIPGLREFAQEALQRSASLVTIRVARRKRSNDEIRLPLVHTLIDSNSLFNLLPLRGATDRLVRHYLKTFHHIFNVISAPDFEQDYHRLWSDYTTVDQRFLVIVLLIVYISSCGDSHRLMLNAGDGSIDQPGSILSTCEAWIRQRIISYKTTSDFQINFLFLLAKQLSRWRNKQTYANSNKIMADFMCAGLHRAPTPMDPALADGDKVLRRKLWLSLAEFELQAAFEQGMPASPWPHQSDILEQIRSPESLPTSTAQSEEYGPHSFLEVASESSLFRHRLNSRLNDLYQRITFTEVKELTEVIEIFLSRIPQWRDPASRTTSAWLHLSLCQYMLALHTYCLKVTKIPYEKRISQMTLLDTAMRMITIHKTLHEQEIMTLDLIFEDYIRVSLSICFAYTSIDRQMNTGLDIRGARSALDDAAALLKEKTIKYSFDHRQLWMVLAARAFIDSMKDPEGKEEFLQAALAEYEEADAPVSRPPDSASQNLVDETALGMFESQDLWQLDVSDAWDLENWLCYDTELLRDMPGA